MMKRNPLSLFVIFLIMLALLLPLVALAQNGGSADADSAETLLEQARAQAAEREPAAAPPVTLLAPQGVTHPLFVGVDDVTIPAYQIDVITNGFLPAFTGAQVWGAAFDEVNNIVYFNSGATLYEWPVGGVINQLGTITDPGGATQSMVALAFYNGQLYGTKNITTEAIWTIDPATQIANIHIVYPTTHDMGGFAIDPNTGEFYATDDGNLDSLVRINPDGTVDPIAPYPAGQTDIDGLAISHDGYAYLVTDEPGFIYVYDFGAGAYTTPLNNPWTTSEVFSAGAWIREPTEARLAVAHLAPFAPGAGTAVTVTLNATPVLTDFVYGDSTAYLTMPEGSYDVEVFPAGSPTPALSGTFTLTAGVSYSVIAIGDGVNQPLELLALVDDNNPPAAGNFKLRLGHLAPFAAGNATADVRLQDGTPVLTDVNFGDVAAYLELPAGTYDLKITTPGGAVTLIDPVPATFSSGDILSAFATGDGSNQDLGVFAWPSNAIGFFLPLAATIDVDPTEIVVTQVVTSVVSYPLTISNLGAGDLNWDIAEEAAQAANGRSVNSQARQVAGLGDGNGTAQEEASTASSSSGVGAPANTPIFAPTGNVLYDNGPLVNSPGTGVGGADESVLQTVSLGMNTLGFGHQVLNGNRMADDFTIPPGSNWTIDEIVFYAYQTASPITSTITQVNLRIWDGEPGNGGTVIWGDTSTNVMSSTVWSGIYRVTETTTGVATDRPIMASTVNLGGLSLPPGTYWLDWQSDGTLASGPWAPPVTVNGQTTTGNGLQSLTDNGVTWGPANDSGTLTQQGFPFLIMGSSGCSSDIAWASVSPTSGTTAGGDSSEVMVTFDTTGLTVGSTYTGTLCVNSNDPVTPLVTVPLTLTVAAQSFGVEVAAEDADLSGDAGTTVTYTVWVTNTGNVEDTFDLTATGVWDATPSVASVTLAAGGTTSVMVTVDIPAGVEDGDMDVTTFTATSQSDASATDSVDLTTTAVVVDTTIYIYLPIILKP
ncbi:MAG: DUF4397 domain-containing protein [Anaerolineae bacterium]|nr:DUF4397 domain-containing protein [Anaerolineae bacterium]